MLLEDNDLRLYLSTLLRIYVSQTYNPVQEDNKEIDTKCEEWCDKSKLKLYTVYVGCISVWIEQMFD